MIRQITIEEIPKIYPYVYEIFAAMELPALQKLSDDLLENIMIEAMHQPHYRYGYKNAWVSERNGKIAGAFFGYPSEWEALIDGPLQASMVKYGQATHTIQQENESLAGEWYLDTLVTDPQFRRQGVGREMLTAAADIATKAGYQKIALNCEVDNQAAYSLYKKMGYQEKIQIVLSNHIYWHMVKEL